MKKLLPLLIVLCFVLCGCGGEEVIEPTEPVTPQPQETTTEQHLRPHLNPNEQGGDVQFPDVTSQITAAPGSTAAPTESEVLATPTAKQRDVLKDLGYKDTEIKKVDETQTVDLGYGARYEIEQRPSNPKRISYIYEASDFNVDNIVRDCNKIFGTELTECDVQGIIDGSVSFAYGANGSFVSFNCTKTTFTAYTLE